MSEQAKQQIIEILDLLTTGQISIEEAARRAEILDTTPHQYTCSTCRFWSNRHPDIPVDRRDTQGVCQSPCQPEHLEHKDSVRCGWWEQFDQRDVALSDAGQIRPRQRELAQETGTSYRAWK